MTDVQVRYEADALKISAKYKGPDADDAPPLDSLTPNAETLAAIAEADAYLKATGQTVVSGPSQPDAPPQPGTATVRRDDLRWALEHLPTDDDDVARYVRLAQAGDAALRSSADAPPPNTVIPNAEAWAALDAYVTVRRDDLDLVEKYIDHDLMVEKGDMRADQAFERILAIVHAPPAPSTEKE